MHLGPRPAKFRAFIITRLIIQDFFIRKIYNINIFHSSSNFNVIYKIISQKDCFLFWLRRIIKTNLCPRWDTSLSLFITGSFPCSLKCFFSKNCNNYSPPLAKNVEIMVLKCKFFKNFVVLLLRQEKKTTFRSRKSLSLSITHTLSSSVTPAPMNNLQVFITFLYKY